MSAEVLALVFTLTMVGSSSHGLIYTMLHTGFRKMLPQCCSSGMNTRDSYRSSASDPATRSQRITVDDGMELNEVPCDVMGSQPSIPLGSVDTGISIILK